VAVALTTSTTEADLAAARRRDLSKLAGRSKRLGWALVAFAVVVAGCGLLTAWLGTLHPFAYSRGRALRRRGRARLPRERAGDEWLADIGRIPGAPREAAAGWRTNAATETASVASFAHLACELLAVGAPPDLIERAHADAIDEVRHARLCYALAAAIDGSSVGAAPFPAATAPRDRAVTVRSLALDCIVESCLLESASAEVARRLLEREDLAPPVRRVLETIAIDEVRHAQHGWEIAGWCIAREGTELIAPMQDAVERASRAATAPVVPHDALARYGLAGPELWRACVERSRRECLALLASHVEPRRRAA
jgi:hypothetical protein